MVKRFVLCLLILAMLLLCSCVSTQANVSGVANPVTQTEPDAGVQETEIESESEPEPEKPLLVTSGETTAGTPIVDREESSFSISDVPMQDTPGSSCFSRIGYSGENEILVVTFRDNGNTYLYLDFPQSEWNAFRSADSLGKYYNSNIKGSFTCYKY